jgi:hypothetical protein
MSIGWGVCSKYYVDQKYNNQRIFNVHKNGNKQEQTINKILKIKKNLLWIQNGWWYMDGTRVMVNELHPLDENVDVYR